MTHARTLRHAAAFAFLGLITLPVACGSDDDEKASPSTGGTGGSDAGGTGGTGGSGATDGGDAACTFGEPQVKTCNLLDNDCPCGAKCSVIETNANPVKNERACVALKGTKAKSEECTREKRGIDDCGQGLFCNTHGLGAGATGKWACLSLCVKTADCAESEVCIDTLPSDKSPDKVFSGLCQAKCDPFNVAATCAPGANCVVFAAAGGSDSVVCSFGFGSAAEGSPCVNAVGDCGPGLLCVKAPWEDSSTCRAFCDSTHGCPADRDCVPLTLESYGTCVPHGTDAASDAGTDGSTDASLD
ncbi:MAG: hypothetical protein IT375_35025 [Polyangiaceae bacterium]|nr:hypothetical protein [Polyangiaceae bacterium]